MLIDADSLHTWKERRRRGRVAPDTIAVDYGYLEPPVDVFAIANRLGVEIRAFKENARHRGDGVLIVRDGQPYIIIQESHPMVRQRFTVAHELGHLMLHEIKEFHQDDRIRISDVHWRDARSGPYTQSIKEAEANQFAAELLMPTFMMQGQDPRSSVDGLARIFNVSSAAMKLRLRELYGLTSRV